MSALIAVALAAAVIFYAALSTTGSLVVAVFATGLILSAFLAWVLAAAAGDADDRDGTR